MKIQERVQDYPSLIFFLGKLKDTNWMVPEAQNEKRYRTALNYK
jgi:hypothetical protein